jgi:hypothetical protein
VNKKVNKNKVSAPFAAEKASRFSVWAERGKTQLEVGLVGNYFKIRKGVNDEKQGFAWSNFIFGGNIWWFVFSLGARITKGRKFFRCEMGQCL